MASGSASSTRGAVDLGAFGSVAERLAVTLPRTAKTVVELAEVNDWSVQVGQLEHQTGIRCERDGHVVKAFWEEGRFTAAVVQHPPMKLLQRDLKDLLSTPVEEFGFDQWPPDLKDSIRENVRMEYEACGYYISGHPLDYVEMRRYPDVVDVNKLDDLSDGERVQVLGVVEDPEVKRTRRGSWMCFFGISDLTGLAPIIGFGEEYKDMKAGELVHVKGVIDIRDGDKQIKARTVTEVKW